jgi:hypothetical protein
MSKSLEREANYLGDIFQMAILIGVLYFTDATTGMYVALGFASASAYGFVQAFRAAD